MISIDFKRKDRCYCDDYWNIENYEQAINDNTQTWVCHHRLELNPDGSVRFTLQSLKELDLYYHRPASELIFLTNKDHVKLHNSIVKTNKRDRHGKNNPMYGKHHKKETKSKIGNKIRNVERKRNSKGQFV